LGALDSTIRDVWIPGSVGGHRFEIEGSVFILRNMVHTTNFAMKEKYHIYMADNSRISIAGLNEGNLEYVARSIAQCLLGIDDLRTPGHYH
jgi:hypothetical protein